MKSDVTHINVGYFIISMPGVTAKNGRVRLRKSVFKEIVAIASM